MFIHVCKLDLYCLLWFKNVFKIHHKSNIKDNKGKKKDAIFLAQPGWSEIQQLTQGQKYGVQGQFTDLINITLIHKLYKNSKWGIDNFNKSSYSNGADLVGPGEGGL